MNNAARGIRYVAHLDEERARARAYYQAHRDEQRARKACRVSQQALCPPASAVRGVRRRTRRLPSQPRPLRDLPSPAHRPVTPPTKPRKDPTNEKRTTPEINR